MCDFVFSCFILLDQGRPVTILGH